MYQLALVFVGLLAAVSRINAECANACNGHGKCTSFDMCLCNRNWQAADCSERVCQFGLAHVDTPKGDLDGSGAVTSANEVVVDNSYVYPYGTTEQFPQMQDSDLQTLSDTAHYYMECSNKGRCDRSSGECQCFEGYDGVACQRASCPGYPHSCSGHGVCKTIRQLASADYGNVYELWDKDATMGCECDAGYSGADCSQRLCKYGVDPLYLDDAATVHYSTWDVGIITTGGAMNFTSNIYDNDHGYFALRVFDNHGEDWVTGPIQISASCDSVVAALEALPNNVVPHNSILCTRTMFTKANGSELTFTSDNAFYDAQNPSTSTHPYRIFYKLALWEAQTSAAFDELSPATSVTPYFSSFEASNATNVPFLVGSIYRLKFYGNPGKLRQPEVEVYLDGNLPTLLHQGKKVITRVWTDGQQGEDNDYFADHCAGVTVTIAQSAARGTSYLTGFTTKEKALLKACLGDSDMDTSNNVEVYNWDYGSKYYPHMIKLVRSVTTLTDGGYYAAIYYGPQNSNEYDNTQDGYVFRLLNPFLPPDEFSTDNYDVYTTQGTLALTSEFSQATFSFASRYIYTTNITYDLANPLKDNLVDVEYQRFDGDISCEHNAKNSDFILHCLNKTDLFTVLSWSAPGHNPPHINLYTAERVYTQAALHSSKDLWADASFTANHLGLKQDNVLHHMTHMITTDISTNWGVAVDNNRISNTVNPQFHVYKFVPAAQSTYNYVNECSNRGLCDRDAGVCKCFGGYTGDSCSDQSSLAL
jgi:hypothetical protein